MAVKRKGHLHEGGERRKKVSNSHRGVSKRGAAEGGGGEGTFGGYSRPPICVKSVASI